MMPHRKTIDDVGRLEAFRHALVTVFIVAIPLEVWIPVHLFEAASFSLYYRNVNFFVPLDMLTVAVMVVGAPVVVARVRRRAFSTAEVLLAAFIAWALLAFAVNPSILGASFAVRWMAMLPTVAIVASMSEKSLRWFVAAPFLVSGIAQTALGLWQHPGPGQNLWFNESVSAAQGTYTYASGLALFLLVAATIGVALQPTGRATLPWMVGTGVCAAGVSLTNSRAGLLAMACIAITFAVGWVRNKMWRRAFIVTSVPYLVTTLFVRSGWVAEVSRTTTGTLEARTSGRISMMIESFRIIQSSPVAGVGPGGYASEILARQPDWGVWRQLPVHNIPLLAASELGIVAGLIIATLAVVLAIGAIRASFAAVAVFAPVAVFMLVEQRTHYIPADVALFAVWMGVLLVLRGSSDSTGLPSEAGRDEHSGKQSAWDPDVSLASIEDK